VTRFHPLRRLAVIAASVLLGSAFVNAADAPRAVGATRRILADTGVPARPRLPDSVDARDWRSYFRCALHAEKPAEEHACLYWGARLEPEAPELHYLRYLLSVLKDTASASRARELDPFFYQTRIVVLHSKAGVMTAASRRGWILLEGADYFGATRTFLRYLEHKPGDVEARWGAALAYHYRGRDDSAAAQLGLMIDTLRQRQDRRTASYMSLEFLEFARATALRLARDTAGARAALEGALTENFGSFLARMMLADIVTAAGDTARAAEHWAAAMELGGGDLVVRARHARFLARVGRNGEAERELGALIAAEPHWVSLRRDLAVVLDAAGPERRADAVRAYAAYLERAPRDPAAPRELAERRLATLRGEPAPGVPRRVPD
jgi:Flp pilus assembly protein TadD